MEFDQFEALVGEVIDSLPDMFFDALDNVDIVVEDFPDRHTMRLARGHSPYSLLGFYHGVPLTARTTNYGLISPDKISIYRRPIEAQCQTVDEVKALTRTVVLHEIGHFFGLSDDRLRELGAY
jgi:predicted Zn-dependent protease with MMP-like domain